MSESSERNTRITWLVRLAPWLLVAGLVLFHAINNWIWLTENVTSTGWDKPRHLARSLYLAGLLSPVTLRSLFQLVVSDPVRTPLFPATGAIMYKLFGPSADAATMVNVFYMVIVLVATYGIGRRWGGRSLGLVSVTLLAVFPMFYAMSRYFYMEFALGAMVALTVYAMLVTSGFRRHGASLLFGLVLGLGLLTKRTFLVFASGPVFVFVLTSGLLPMLWQRLKQRPRFYWKNALVALVGGLVPAAIWYLPNRDAVRELILGDALFVVWWALAALAIYFATLRPEPLANAVAAFFLAAGLGSTWYLARLEFVRRVALYGYGVDDPRGRTLRLGDLDTYLYYLRKMGNEHLSLVLFIVFLVVLTVAVTIYLRRQGTLGRALRHLKPEGWVVLAWAVGGYAVLTLSIYQETRAYTPALPAIALIFGAALLQLPWRRLRWGILALVLAFGVLQFFVVSYEPLYRLLPAKTMILPGWGRTSSFAQGVYIQLPDEGKTDKGYAIYPDVLRRMEQRRQQVGRDLLSLGLLVNTSQINAGPFNFLILTDYPQLRVKSLIDRFSEESPYRYLFAHDYVIVKRINAGMNPVQKQVILDILEGPPPLFVQAYELETTYPLPDGDTVYLYRQRYPLPADYPIEYITRLDEDLGGRARAGDAILVTPPGLLAPLVANYEGPAEVCLAPAAEGELADIAAQHRRVFLVLGDAASGDVQGLAQDWLNQHAFRAAHEWFDSLQLVTYGTLASPPATAPSVGVHADLGGQIELVGYDLPATPWAPGDIVPLTLVWQRQVAVAEDYHVFVHLIDKNGQLIAQTDSMPAGGSRPTSGWGDDELVIDRHGLLLPDTLPAGDYELYVGVYRLATGDRLPVLGAHGEVQGDSIALGWAKVISP